MVTLSSLLNQGDKI